MQGCNECLKHEIINKQKFKHGMLVLILGWGEITCNLMLVEWKYCGEKEKEKRGTSQRQGNVMIIEFVSMLSFRGCENDILRKGN